MDNIEASKLKIGDCLINNHQGGSSLGIGMCGKIIQIIYYGDGTVEKFSVDSDTHWYWLVHEVEIISEKELFKHRLLSS